MKRRNEPSRPPESFHADGDMRLHQAIEPAIRAEVEREFAERLAGAASWWRRWTVRREIEREIGKRLRQKASEYTLY
jgi:hypothetical protein